MKQLSENWFVEPLFDYEYKSYEIMAYAKAIEQRFSESKFYPYLSEVQRHIRNLEAFSKAKSDMEAQMRSELKDIDLQKLALIRDALPDDSGLISELNDIISFAQKRFEFLQSSGSKVLNELSKFIEISPLGMLGALENPGFLLFKHESNIRIYTYRFRYVRRPFGSENYKDVCTAYHSELTAHRFSNLNHIKWDLVKSQKGLDQAVNAYLVESKLALPQYETLVPFAKEYLIKTATAA